MPKSLNKIISIAISILLLFEQSGFAAGGAIDLSSSFAKLTSGISTSLSLSATNTVFRPIHLRYLEYLPKDNSFKLLLDKGDSQKEAVTRHSRASGNPGSSNSTNPSNPITQATQDLMNYFYIGLTLPNDSFWVNLRPDSPDNIIDTYLSKTDIGRILLEADVQLKKDTSSYTNPSTPEGKVYWNKLYKKAEELFGTDQITIPTLTRPWIVPGEIIIRETGDSLIHSSGSLTINNQESNQPSAYIYKATLKVMLEEDYLKNPQSIVNSPQNYSFTDPRLKELNSYSTTLIKELIIPKLTKEVNSSKRYASLRQVYYSLILAQWFKARYKPTANSPQIIDTSLRALEGRSNLDSNVTNLIDKKNLTNLASKTPWNKSTYFNQYQQSFTKGEYNTKETVYTPSGQVVRSYMSGGIKIMPEGIVSVSSPLNKTANPIITIAAGSSSPLQLGSRFNALLLVTAGALVVSGNSSSKLKPQDSANSKIGAELKPIEIVYSPKSTASTQKLEVKRLEAKAFNGDKQAVDDLISLASKGNNDAVESLKFLADHYNEAAEDGIQVLNPTPFIQSFKQGNSKSVESLKILAHGGNNAAEEGRKYIQILSQRDIAPGYVWFDLDGRPKFEVEEQATLFSVVQRLWGGMFSRIELNDLMDKIKEDNPHIRGNNLNIGDRLDIFSAFKLNELKQALNNSTLISKENVVCEGRNVTVYFVICNNKDGLGKTLIAETILDKYILIDVPRFVDNVKLIRKDSIMPIDGLPGREELMQGLFAKKSDEEVFSFWLEEMLYHEFVHTVTGRLIKSGIINNEHIGKMLHSIEYDDLIEPQEALYAGERKRLLVQKMLFQMELGSYLAQIAYSRYPKYALDFMDGFSFSVGGISYSKQYTAVGKAIKERLFERLGYRQFVINREIEQNSSENAGLNKKEQIESLNKWYDAGDRTFFSYNYFIEFINSLTDEQIKQAAKEEYELIFGALPSLKIRIPYKVLEAAGHGVSVAPAKVSGDSKGSSSINNIQSGANTKHPTLNFKEFAASSALGGYIPAIGQVMNQIEQFYWSFLDLLNTAEYVAMSLMGAGFLAYTTVKILRDFVSVFKKNDLTSGIPGDKESVSDLGDNDTTIAKDREDKTAINPERADRKPEAILRITSAYLNKFFNKLYPSVSSRITKHLDEGFNDSYYLDINGRQWVVKLSEYPDVNGGAKLCQQAWIKETRISRLTEGIKGIVANDPVKFLRNAGRPQLAQALETALISNDQAVIDGIIENYFTIGGKIIFVSEKFDNGCPLSQWAYVNKGNNIKAKERIMHSLNAVLANMHSYGIAHLDLKPQNVWVFDNNEAAVFDFESAVLITNNSEEEWAFHGISPLATPLYTHPLSYLTWDGKVNKLLINGQVRQFYYSCDLYSLEMIKLFLDSRLNISGRDKNLVALILRSSLYDDLDLDNHPERLLDYHLFVQKAIEGVEKFKNNSASSALNAEAFETNLGQVAFVPLRKKIGGLDEKGRRLGGKLVSEFIGDVWIIAGSFPYRVLVAGDKVYVQRYNKERTFNLAYPRLINMNESFAIGRNFDANIFDAKLSRKHCQFKVYREGNKNMLELIDSESSNGTIVELFYPHLKSSADEYDITRQIILGYKTLLPQDRLITTSTGTLRVVSRVENGLVISMRTENGQTRETHERLSDVLMLIENHAIKVIRPASGVVSSALSVKDRFIKQGIKEVYLSFVLEDTVGNKKEVIVRPYQDSDYSSIGVYDMDNSDNLVAYIRDSALRNGKNGSMLLVADSGTKDTPQIEGVLHFLLEDDPEYGEHIFEDETNKENIPYPIVHLVGMAVKKENKSGVGTGLRGVGRALVAGVVKTSFESEGIKKGKGHLLVENASRLDSNDRDPANFYFALGMVNLKNNTYYFDADSGKLFLKELENKGAFSDLTDDFNSPLEEYQSFNGDMPPSFKKYNEIIPKDKRTGNVFVSDLPVRDRIVSEIKKTMKLNGIDSNSAFSFLLARKGLLYEALGYIVENLAQHEFVDDTNLVMRVYLTDEPYMGIRIEFLGLASQDLPSKFKEKDWFSHVDRPWAGVYAPNDARSGKTWLGLGISRVFEHFLNVERYLELPSDRHILMGWREAGINEGCPVGSHIIAMHLPTEVVGYSGVSSPLRMNQGDLLGIIKTRINTLRVNKLNSSGVFSTAEVENLLNNLAELRNGRDIPQSMKSRIAGFFIIADCWKQMQEFLPNEIKILIFSMLKETDDISEVEKKYNFSNGYFWPKGNSFADDAALKIDSEVKNFVDVGCGTGTTAVALATKYPGLEVIAVDANANNLKILFDNISNLDLPNLKIQYGDAGKLLKTMPPGTIDRVLFKDYFHYWKQYASLRGLIRASIPLLNENGIIVIKGATGPSDAKVISKIGSSLKIPVSAVFEKTVNGIDIMTVAKENKVGGSNFSNPTASSAVEKMDRVEEDPSLRSGSMPQTPKNAGGIDFRSLPIVTQAVSNLGLSTMSQELRNILINFNLSSELNEIERLANAGITPSTQRIKEYIQASSISAINSPEDNQKLLSCFADILRKQEEECCVTDPTLKDILVVLESGLS